MDKLTHEQRVLMMAERMQKGYFKTGKIPSMSDQKRAHANCLKKARIAVASQSEAIREAIQKMNEDEEMREDVDENMCDFLINEYLIENGYVPLTQEVQHQDRLPEGPKVVEPILNEDFKKPTDKYKSCNHHHELTADHEIVDFGDGEFVANKAGIPLLKALNEAGLRTRTHHIDHKGNNFVSILCHNVDAELKMVNEIDATRTKYNGYYELLIRWENAPANRDKEA